MWNNISKRHGHLLLLIITTCKAWKCLRCSYFLNDWLAPLFIHIRKKPSGERKSSVAAETWKSHFWHCSLVDVILGNVLLKAMIFQGEEIYIYFFHSRLFVGTYCPLWSQAQIKPGLFLPSLAVPGQACFEARVQNLYWSLSPATPCLYLLNLFFRGLSAAWPFHKLLERLVFPCYVEALRAARGVCV